MIAGLRDAFVGALLIAGVSTVGDFIWAMWIPRHRWFFGLVHGTLLFLALGLYLGMRVNRAREGALGGAVVGCLAAASFYALAPLTGYSAMFIVYFALWITLAYLVSRLAGPRVALAETLARGLVAAVGSGAAFYAVSGIWFPFQPRGWDYAVHFGSWTLAYLPGFLALLVGRSSRA
jgi:hypothetical protein